MSKPVPTTGASNWGVVLNSHLAQLQKADTGGINFGTSDPTSVTNGYTYINTTRKEIRRYNGSSWEILLAIPSIYEEYLTEDKNIYVSPSGNDNNNGNSTTSPYLTIQKAFNRVGAIFANNFKVIINLAPGAYPPENRAFIQGPQSQSGTTNAVTIKGTGTNPSDTIIQGDGSTNLSLALRVGFSQLVMENLKLEATNNGSCLEVFKSGTVFANNVEFGSSPGNAHIFVNTGGTFQTTVGYKISGSASSHLVVQTNGMYLPGNGTSPAPVTMVNNPAFTNFVVASTSGAADFRLVSISGGFAPGALYTETGGVVYRGSNQALINAQVQNNTGVNNPGGWVV